MNKAKLKAFRERAKEIDQLVTTIDNLRAKRGPKISNYDGDGIRGSGDGTGIERAVEAIIEVEERYNQRLIEYANILMEIEEAVTILRPAERCAIRLYYIDNMSWEAVACQMGVSFRQVHYLHASALIKMEAAEEAIREQARARDRTKPDNNQEDDGKSLSGLLTDE